MSLYIGSPKAVCNALNYKYYNVNSDENKYSYFKEERKYTVHPAKYRLSLYVILIAK